MEKQSKSFLYLCSPLVLSFRLAPGALYLNIVVLTEVDSKWAGQEASNVSSLFLTERVSPSSFWL